MNAEHEYRIRNLIRGIITRSDTKNPWAANTVDWEETAPDTFDLSLTKTTIRIGSHDADGQYPYRFEILDENGRTIELIVRESGNDEFGLDQLYEAASRNYRKVDERLTAIMRELNIEDPPYSPPRYSGDEEPPF